MRPSPRVASILSFTAPIALAALVALVAPVAPARAQVPDSSTAFQVEIFEPQPAQGVNLLNLLKSDVMQHLYPSFGVFAQYVDDPFELARQADQDVVVSRLIQSQVTVSPWAAFGLFDIVDVGIVVPLVVSQSGGSLAFFNRPADAVAGFTLGDMRIIPKVRLLDPEDAAGFGLALAAQIYVPTGDSDTFNSYGSVRFAPTLALDWRDAHSGFAIAANIGYVFQPRTTAHNLVLDDNLRWGIGLEIPLVRDEVKLLATLHGILALADNRDPGDLSKVLADSFTSPMETDLALNLRFDAFVVQLGGGLGLSDGVGAPDFRAFLSFGYTPVTHDRDGDGILDRDDKCPDVPEDKDGFEDEDGCPDLDNDKDGIVDVSDGAPEPNGFGACRDTPEDKDGFEDQDGCPDPDNDQDGIADTADGPQDGLSGFGACRDTPEDKDGFEDQDGCPDPDNDQDGIPDVSDGGPDAALVGFGRCRNEPEDKDGNQDQDGCPDPDNDRDGVLDLVDGAKDASGFGVCRDQPETVNGIADNDGCPEAEAPKRVRVTQFQIEILDKIFFDYNKATIQPVSFSLLDEVSAVLKQHPQLTKIRVEGHTDFHGDDNYNLDLSQLRADAVAVYLFEHGIEPVRIESKGWGEQRPLVTGRAGKTNDGRAKNRRVEFHIIEVNGQPHSPEKPVILEKHEVVP